MEPFTHAFEMAEQAALSPRDRLLYEASLKSARDAYAEIMSAREKGREEGREEGRQEGRQEGEATVMLQLLKCRYGRISATTERKIRHLPVEKLEALAGAVLDFSSAADLDRWLRSGTADAAGGIKGRRAA